MKILKAYFSSFLYSKVFIVSAFLFSIFVTIVIYIQVRDEEQRIYDLELEQKVNKYSSLFSLKISSHLNELNNVLRFYNSSRQVNFNLFNSFVAPAFEKGNDIHAIEWVPRVSFIQLKKHQKQFRVIINDYYVWQRGPNNKKQVVAQKEYYYPIKFIYPYIPVAF